MERLTKYGKTSHENGVCCTHFMSKECKEVAGDCAMGCKWEEEAWSKLAHYEDLEEQGLLLKLPFPLGTKRLYWIDMSEEDKEVYQLDATDLNIKKTDISDTIIYTIDDYDFVKSDFGKTVFLTKEEAEAKLKELENE